MSGTNRIRPLIVAAAAILSLALLTFAGAARAQEDDVQRYLRHRIEDLESQGRLVVRGTTLVADVFVAKLYAHVHFKRVWTDPKKVSDMVRAIEDSALDGLDPEDYYLAQLKALKGKVELTDDPTLAADLDLLLTDAMAQLAYHAFFGKVDPERLDQTWNFPQSWHGKDSLHTALEFLASKSLHDAIEGLKPRHPAYDRFRKALAKYRGYQAAGGWKPIPRGAALKPDKKDPRLPAVRHRLAITEDLPKEHDNGSDVYDAPLQQAVTNFQKRHHMAVIDLNSMTIDAMNVPVERRIEQIRLNLERARWILRELPERLVLVNAAAFEISYWEKDKMIWKNRAQVGRTFSETPQYRDDIQYLVLNPTWTVPPGVLEGTVLPAAKADPGYIRSKNIRVIDPDRGEIDPRKVKWGNYNAKNFPYVLRQDPGPDNALGSVIFMFPNPYHIYLHDTPNQTGYKARQRDMSWGCVHVFEPLELAEKLIASPQRWSLDVIKKQVQSGKSETVHLEKPVPVMLLYWTVAAPKDGPIEFIPDVYKRDAAVLKALERDAKRRRERRRSDAATGATEE